MPRLQTLWRNFAHKSGFILVKERFAQDNGRKETQESAHRCDAFVYRSYETRLPK